MPDESSNETIVRPTVVVIDPRQEAKAGGEPISLASLVTQSSYASWDWQTDVIRSGMAGRVEVIYRSGPDAPNAGELLDAFLRFAWRLRHDQSVDKQN
jgi:hypothetical protein